MPLHRYTVFSGVFQFLIPVVLISIVYIRILLFIKVARIWMFSQIIVHKSKLILAEIMFFNAFYCDFILTLQKNRVSQPSLVAKQKKTYIILFSVSLTFFFSWLPFRSLSTIGGEIQEKPYSYFFLPFLATLVALHFTPVSK